MDAFDADVLIYAAQPEHPLGRRVAALFPAGRTVEDDVIVGVGSTLLLPEVLSLPVRAGSRDEVRLLGWFLERLDLLPADRPTAELAVTLGSTYRLRAADAVHLATAVAAGADRFLTNNRRDFSLDIEELEIVYPDMLDEAPG